MFILLVGVARPEDFATPFRLTIASTMQTPGFVGTTSFLMITQPCSAAETTDSSRTSFVRTCEDLHSEKTV